MEKFDPIVKTYYAKLEEGKIIGMKCKECGEVLYPPMPICDRCSSTNVEWYEVNRRATLLHGGELAEMHHEEVIRPYEPCRWGEIQMEDGPLITAMVIGLPGTDEEINKRCPLPVEMVIIQDNGFKTTAFKVAE